MLAPQGTRDPRAVAVRVVFGAALLVLPLQHVVSSLGGEPYPGLYQPSFGGRLQDGDVAVTVEPEVTVVDASGAESVVAYQDLLPTTRVLRLVVFQEEFLHGEQTQAPETAAWVRQRLTTLRPGSDPRSVRIDWREVERDLGGEGVRVLGTVDVVEIDLGTER